ncbi:MAG: hypothetical protein MJ176_03130 [Treponema sp.]|nr:hypothetical protein [Treponema sp.]
MTDEEKVEKIKQFIDLLSGANTCQREIKERPRVLVNLDGEFSSDLEVALRQTIDYYIL